MECVKKLFYICLKELSMLKLLINLALNTVLFSNAWDTSMTIMK